MSISAYHVKRIRESGYAVMLGGKRVSNFLSSRELAENKAEAMARARSSQTRKCMNCSSSFKSEGPHNRLCNPCRALRAFDGSA